MKCTMCTNQEMEYQLASIDSRWGEKTIKLYNVKGYICDCGHIVFDPDEAKAMQTITQVIADHAPDIYEVTLERPEVSTQAQFDTVRQALEAKQASQDPMCCPKDSTPFVVDVTEDGDLYLRCPLEECPAQVVIQAAYQVKLPEDYPLGG